MRRPSAKRVPIHPAVALQALPSLLETSTKVKTVSPRKQDGNLSEFMRLEETLRIDEIPHAATLKIRREYSGNYYYDQLVIQKNSPYKLVATNVAGPAGESSGSIDKEISKVKPTDKEKYSAPSEAQREAGNYPKKHISLHGLDTSIETAKGERRRPEWPPMPCDYGYIRGTVGKDKDHVDVFIGPNKKSELVVVVDQIDQNVQFDEYEILLGFSNEVLAISQYKKAYLARMAP